jgi:hypothetical protein
MSENNSEKKERGNSEVLGSVIIILIISVTIAILFATAWPIMDDVRGDVRERGIKDSFHSFKEMVDRTLVGVDPLMGIKFPLSGGMLYTNSSTKLLLGVYEWNSSNSSWDLIFSSSADYENVGKFAYDYDYEWGYLYEMGALIKWRGDYAKVISSPRITYLERTGGHRYLSLPIVIVEGDLSAGGEGTHEIQVSVLEVEPHDFYNVSVDLAIESDYPEAWYRFLNDIGMNVSIVGNRVTTFMRHYDEVHITYYRIRVQ